MKKKILIVAAAVLACAVAALSIVYFKVWRFDMEFNEYRGNLAVENASRDNSKDKIHFLKTGSSDAILIESQGHFALVDAAEDSDNPRGFEELEFEGYEDVVVDYLKKNASQKDGKVHLDFILGTHSHSDHIGGFDTVIYDDDIIIDKAFLKEYKEEQIREKEVVEWDNQEVYDQMITALKSKSIPVVSDISSEPFDFGNFKLTFFNTVDENTEKVGENDNSLGVLVEKKGARIFLSGDIDNISGDEDRIGAELGHIDVLKVGHHSYAKSTSEGWLENLSPAVCVVTNDYERCDKKTLRRITQIAKCPILITGAENGVIVSVDDSGKISYFNEIME
ncbi:MAG: MBL fold metallo-hydrolase [Eubacterium sp.]|nr:MBL fold metallo-hydrolase [Eubacterium sp.]MBR4242077.1 MBL fold metallo-hydrolase [Eubacterium sp.]